MIVRQHNPQQPLSQPPQPPQRRLRRRPRYYHHSTPPAQPEPLAVVGRRQQVDGNLIHTPYWTAPFAAGFASELKRPAGGSRHFHSSIAAAALDFERRIPGAGPDWLLKSTDDFAGPLPCSWTPTAQLSPYWWKRFARPETG